MVKVLAKIYNISSVENNILNLLQEKQEVYTRFNFHPVKIIMSEINRFEETCCCKLLVEFHWIICERSSRDTNLRKEWREEKWIGERFNLHCSNKSEDVLFPGLLHYRVKDPTHYTQPQQVVHLYLAGQTHQPSLVDRPTSRVDKNQCMHMK